MDDVVWTVEAGEGKRGRRFSARGVGLLAPKGGYNDPLRPWWASFACEEGAFRALLANILMGRRIELGSSSRKMEFQRSRNYVYRSQRLPDGMMAATIYLPDLFDLDVPPPEDEEDAKQTRFVILPDLGWLERSALTRDDINMAWACARSVIVEDEDLSRAFRRGRKAELRLTGPMSKVPCAETVALAALLGAQLDHRLRTPLLPDLGFYLHLLRVMSALHLAFRPEDDDRNKWSWFADPRSGYLSPTVVQGTTEAMEAAVLAAIVSYIPAE